MIGQWLVRAAQIVLWIIFMSIDAYLLIPGIIIRYLSRVKSHSQLDRRRPPKTVVIVGGSFSGLVALRELQNNPLFRVILIDQRDYFEYTPGILRLLVEPEHARKICHPLPHRSHTVLQGKVTSTSNATVTYVDSSKKNKTIKFDYLILATGTTYQYPVSASHDEYTLHGRMAGWHVQAKKVEDASSILILGGGAVGTELAAEIVCHYGSTKSITVVDAADRLVPLFPKSVSDYAQQWLQSRGVHLKLGQKLQSWNNKSCTLEDGHQTLTADIVFACLTAKANSNPMVAKMPFTNGTTVSPVKLDRSKRIIVDSFLRVEERRNVFCCGDVAAPPTEGHLKQAFHAEVTGHVAAENIMRLANGRRFMRYPEDAAMGSHQMPLVYVLSLGKWDGVIGFNSLTVPGPVAALMKWIIEFTKVRQMLNRPVGLLVWVIGDWACFLLSSTIVKPLHKKV